MMLTACRTPPVPSDPGRKRPLLGETVATSAPAGGGAHLAQPPEATPQPHKPFDLFDHHSNAVLVTSRRTLRRSAMFAVDKRASVTVRLHDSGSLTAKDAGSESSFSHSENPRMERSATKTWNFAWGGRWEMDGDELNLQFQLQAASWERVSEEIKRGKRSSDKRVGKAFPSTLTIGCKLEEAQLSAGVIEINGVRQPAHKVKTMAWVCSVPAGVQHGGTRLPWLFRIDRIQRN